MIRRKLIIAALAGALLLSACTRIAPQQQENLVSDVPDFESIERELESSREAAKADENKTEESGEGMTTEEDDEDVSKDTTADSESQEESTVQTETEPTVTEQATVKPTENVTTEKTTEKVTEKVTEKATEKATTQSATVKPTEAATTQPATTKQTEAATTQPVTESTTTAAPVVSADNGALKTFSVQSLDGKTYTQEIFTKADVNIVIFWATWCGYCKLEMPVLEDLQKNYAGKSVQIFSVVMNAEGDYYKSVTESLIAEMGITYPCLIFNDSMQDGYCDTITGYPNTVYLNRNGEVMHSVPGAYAGYGHDYALSIHSQYLDFCLANPDYVMPEE